MGTSPQESDEKEFADKVNASAGIKFEQRMPRIKDSDMDLDRHLREFEAPLSMHAYGRRAVRPLDRWIPVQQEGGIRYRIYMMNDRKAQRMNRLPAEAQAV